MKKVIFLLSVLLFQQLHADFWSKLVDVKVVKNTPQDMYEYGYRTGYGDAQNTNNERYTNDNNYNKGYRDGYIQGVVTKDGYVIVEQPSRRHYDNYENNRVIIIDRNYDPNRVELIR